MPLSDLSYDILTSLQSKLEALDVYEQFIDDCEEAGEDGCRQLFEEMRQDDERHVERLTSELERLVREGKFR